MKVNEGLIVATLLLIACALAVLWALAIRREKDLREARKHRDNFFGHAERLLEDNRVPEHWIRFVVLIAHTITWPESPKTLWQSTRKSRVDRQVDAELLPAVEGMPKEVLIELRQALVASMFAISYRSTVYGPLIRRKIRSLKQKNGPASQNMKRILTTAARTIQAHDHGQPHAA